MEYDPIKRSLGNVFNKSSFLRKTFYHLLDLLLLRAWHIHSELTAWGKELGDNANILDAGAGFGQYSYWLSNKFPKAKILSVDVKEEQVADCNNFFQAIGKKNVKFEVADLTKFVQENKPARPAGGYDLVISVDVMEHILEDVLVFKNIHASLKQGGMLLVSTPSDQGGSDVAPSIPPLCESPYFCRTRRGNSEIPSPVFPPSEGEGASFISEHVREGYNMKEIEDKLKTAGFSKVEARYAYGTPGKIAWKLSMKYPMQLLNASKLFFIIIPFYYLITYPFAFILNYLDTDTTHKTGTGLIVKAWK